MSRQTLEDWSTHFRGLSVHEQIQDLNSFQNRENVVFGLHPFLGRSEWKLYVVCFVKCFSTLIIF